MLTLPSMRRSTTVYVVEDGFRSSCVDATSLRTTRMSSAICRSEREEEAAEKEVTVRPPTIMRWWCVVCLAIPAHAVTTMKVAMKKAKARPRKRVGPSPLLPLTALNLDRLLEEGMRPSSLRGLGGEEDGGEEERILKRGGGCARSALASKGREGAGAQPRGRECARLVAEAKLPCGGEDCQPKSVFGKV